MSRISRQWWKPNTCDCEIFTLYDANSPSHIHTGIEVGRYEVEGHQGTIRCKIHKAYRNAHEHYLAVLNHNAISK